LDLDNLLTFIVIAYYEESAATNFDELVKSLNSDGFVKSPRSRLANFEECGVLVERRSDEK
jgi:hypothetical protein